jgi:cbb3-type cytochrome oxidase subunit 3
MIEAITAFFIAIFTGVFILAAAVFWIWRRKRRG